MLVIWNPIATLLLLGALGQACSSDLTVTPGRAALSKMVRVDYLSPGIVQANETVLIKGINLSTDLVVSLDEQALETELLESGDLSVTIPSSAPNGPLKLSVADSKKEIKTLSFYKTAPEAEMLSDLPEDAVCSDVSYVDSQGAIHQGQKDCSETIVAVKAPCDASLRKDCVTSETFPAVQKSLLGDGAALSASLTLADVKGQIASCKANETSCYLAAYSVLTQPLRALDESKLNATQIKSGVSIAAVTGSLLTAPKACTTDAEVDCTADSAYPALDKAALDLVKDRILAGTTVAGVSGSLANCADNASACFVKSYDGTAEKRKAVDFDVIVPSKIKNNVSIAGVTGNYVVPYVDCGSDGQTSCLATAAYPAIDKNNADTNKAKFHSTLSLAGVTGTMNNCSVDGADSCLTVSNFPALDKSLLNTQKAKVHASISVAGISGTLNDCAANGANCYLPAYALTTQPLKAISFDSLDATIIKDGSNIGGIIGNVLEAPANCSADGQDSCVTVTAFPSVHKNLVDTNKSKIHSTQTLGGITGTMGDCSGDNGVSCLSSTNYPSVQKSAVNSNKAKIHSSITIAGIPGTLGDCMADGQASCLSTSNYPSADKATIEANKAQLHSSLTLAGVAGTLGSCGANGSACYLPAYVLTTQPLKAISYDSLSAGIIKDGSTISGVAGNLLEAPANCGADGGTNCVTVSNYPSVVKATVDAAKSKVLNTVTLGGVAGTMPPCAADGATSCFSDSDYPALNKSSWTAAQASALTTLSTAGVAGTMGACAANSSACFLATYNAGTQPLKAIDSTPIVATVIRNDTTIGGVAGSMVETPATCALDGATNCVTDANYPAVNKAPIEADKAKIHSSLTIGGVTGTLATCNADAQTSCFTDTNFPSFDKQTIDTNKSKIRTNLTIGGIGGTMADCAAQGANCFIGTYAAGTQPFKAISYDGIASGILRDNTSIAGITGSVVEAPANCNGDNQTNCVAVSNYPAVDKDNVNTNKAKMHGSITSAGIAGTLPDCGADNAQSCLTSANWRSASTSYVDTNKSGISSTLTVTGVAGTLGSCAAQGSACRIASYAAATQPFKAINFDGITAGIIKKDSVIAGITGTYPSASTPLSTGDAYDDLDSTFNAQMASNTVVGWFDRNGTRASHAGDSDLAPGNIKYGHTIFGVPGSFQVPGDWDVRVGQSISSGSSGKLKYNCRNPAHLASGWDAGEARVIQGDDATDTMTAANHGFVDGNQVRFGYGTSGGGLSDVTTYYIRDATTNTFRVSDTDGGAALGISTLVDWAVYRFNDGVAGYADTVDYYMGDGSIPNTTPTWGSNYLCNGVDTTGSSGNVWKDVTTGTCTSGADCRYKDQITNLEWSKPFGNANWQKAVEYCDQLTYDGQSNWRLPTSNEFNTAYTHGIYTANNNDWISKTTFNNWYFWSATRRAGSNDTAYVGYFDDGWFGWGYVNYTYAIVCVRKAGENP